MKWLDNFIVSERGQWDYPGYPTAVPTKNGKITMRGVPYPVMGFVPGKPPVIMQPNRNYQFPGKMVYEIPMPNYRDTGWIVPQNPSTGIKWPTTSSQSTARRYPNPMHFGDGGDISIPDLSRPNWLDKAQNGLQYTGEPTRADSLELLKNARLVQDYYSSKDYENDETFYFSDDFIKKEALKSTEEMRGLYSPFSPRKTPSGAALVPLDQYYMPVDKNKFYQREYANQILDTRAPMQLYDRRILPTAQYSYRNIKPGDRLQGDNVGIYGYDPISITPWDMLTDKQKKLRVKRFGRNGVPEDYDPDRSSVPKNLPYKNVQLLQQPEDRLIREYNTIVPNENYRRVYDQSPYSLKEYGPEGKPTHWAKADEKIPGVWRPMKETPSDLFVNKKVKFSTGGWLDTAQKGKQIKYYDNLEEFEIAKKAEADSLAAYNAYPIPEGSKAYNISTNEFLRDNNPLPGQLIHFDNIRNRDFANNAGVNPAQIEPVGGGIVNNIAWEWVYKKPTVKPVYKEKPKIKNIQPIHAKFEMPDRGLMPITQGLASPSNTGIILRDLQEQDRLKQGPKVVKAPEFQKGSEVKKETYKSLVDPETGVVTKVINEEPPIQWTPLEDVYGIKPSAQKRSDYVPYKDVSGAPYETQDPYAHNYSTVDVPKNLSELPSYRLYAMGVSGNSYKPFSRDWTTGLNLNDAGYVKFDEKTGYNYQPSRQNLQDFQSLPMEGEKAFNLRRFVLNPYEGQPQTHDAYVKKDGTVDKENFIPKSYSREETMDNVFKDLYAQNLYKFKGDRDAAYNATSEFMTERVEPQYRGKYYEYMNNPNVSERDKLNINRVGTHMTVDPIQTEESVSQGIADKLAEEHPEYLTNEDLDFDKAIRADPRYREKLNEYNEVLQDWYVTNKNMSPEEAKALVEKDLYKNVPKRKTTYATFKSGGSLDRYQDGTQVKANLPGYNPEIGPTIKNAELLKQLEMQEAVRNSQSLNLPSGRIDATLGPVEYAVLPALAAPAIKAAMAPKAPADPELEAIRKILRKNVTHIKQTRPLTETPPWPNRFLELGDDAWVIGNMERGRASKPNPDVDLPGRLPKPTPKQLPGVNGTQYPNRLPKQKNGGWLDNYSDYNYIKYKDLSLSRGTGWLDNYK